MRVHALGVRSASRGPVGGVIGGSRGSMVRLRENWKIGLVTFWVTAIFRTRAEAKFGCAVTGFDSDPDLEPMPDFFWNLSISIAASG